VLIYAAFGPAAFAVKVKRVQQQKQLKTAAKGCVNELRWRIPQFPQFGLPNVMGMGLIFC